MRKRAGAKDRGQGRLHGREPWVERQGGAAKGILGNPGELRACPDMTWSTAQVDDSISPPTLAQLEVDGWSGARLSMVHNARVRGAQVFRRGEGDDAALVADGAVEMVDDALVF